MITGWGGMVGKGGGNVIAPFPGTLADSMMGVAPLGAGGGASCLGITIRTGEGLGLTTFGLFTERAETQSYIMLT